MFLNDLDIKRYIPEAKNILFDWYKNISPNTQYIKNVKIFKKTSKISFIGLGDFFRRARKSIKSGKFFVGIGIGTS